MAGGVPGWVSCPGSGGNVPYRIFDKPVMEKSVETLRERRLRQVVHQSVDFSCGAATLATILQYYYGQPVTEQDAIMGMFALGDRAKIRQMGFSLLDMKNFAEKLHYKATGYRIKEIDKLKELKIPVIALIDTQSYKHFVVIRKVTDDYVYLSDPSWGNRRMKLNDFEKVWNNIILAISGPRLADATGTLYRGLPFTVGFVALCYSHRGDPGILDRHGPQFRSDSKQSNQSNRDKRHSYHALIDRSQL